MANRSFLCKALSMALAAGLVLSLGACKPGTQEAATTKEGASVGGAATSKGPDGPTNPLTGETGYRAEAAGRRPVAIMINNAPAARPQWGLCSPDIVVEALAEGGVTRMMWLYADEQSIPEKVGSVRSARHDFVELAEGMDAIFVHWGGSPQAYAAIKDRNVDHIDGMRYSSTYFARDKTRSTAVEHRGYTTGSKVQKAITSLRLRTSWKNASSQPFQFTKNAPRALSGAVCEGIKVSFSSDYNHTFTYHSEDGLYYNYMNSNKMVEDGGKQMAVGNVIVLYTPVSTLDSKGHVDMNLSGGNGYYISGGKMEKITWKKGSAKNPLKLYQESGEALELNPGKSWIGFVPSARESKTVVETSV